MPLRDKHWPGLRQDTTDLGDGLIEALNLQYKKVGELRRRPGLGARYALSATQLAFLESAGGKHLIGFDGTTLTSLNMDTAASTTLASGVDTARGSFALANGALYYANGVDAGRVIYNGANAAQSAGIIAPSTAPSVGTPAAGNVTAGVHLIRFRWKNSTTGYFSNPSPALEYTAAGSENIPLTLGTTADTKVDKMVIEMTEADGSTFYVVETVNDASSYTINIADAVLNQQELSDVYASPDGFGHEPPPAALTTLFSLRNRIFGLTATGTLYWSRASYPEAFNALEWSHPVFSNGGDKAIAMGGFMNSLYIFGQRSCAILDYPHDPASGSFTQLPTTMGVWNQNCLIAAENRLWGFGRQGIFQVADIQPRHISAAVSDTLDADVDVSAFASFFAFFDPKERVIWFCYQKTGDTGVRYAVCYDIQSKVWSKRSFRHKLNHAIVAGDSTRNDFAYIADDNGGYCWRLTDGVFDGVPSTMSSGVVSVNSGASTTVIPTTTAMDDVLGAIVYNPLTGEEARITVSGAYSITVTPAFAAAPAQGAELYIGSIPVQIKSQHVPVEYIFAGRRPEYFELIHLSDTADVEFEVRYYADYGSSPVTWTRTADDAPMTGLSITNGQTYATQDVSSGLSTVPVQGEFTKTIQWQLDQTRPAGTMRLLNAEFTWTDQRGAKGIGS